MFLGAIPGRVGRLGEKMNKSQEAHQKLIEHMARLGDHAYIEPVKEPECRKCGKFEVEPGTTITPLGLFDDETPAIVEVILPCPKCGRVVVAETKLPVSKEDMN